MLIGSIPFKPWCHWWRVEMHLRNAKMQKITEIYLGKTHTHTLILGTDLLLSFTVHIYTWSVFGTSREGNIISCSPVFAVDWFFYVGLILVVVRTKYAFIQNTGIYRSGFCHTNMKSALDSTGILIRVFFLSLQKKRKVPKPFQKLNIRMKPVTMLSRSFIFSYFGICWSHNCLPGTRYVLLCLQ